jgi:hypothetical protein
MYSNGTPDQYYDGEKSDLWVEYKMLEHRPRSGVVRVIPQEKRERRQGELSVLQEKWLMRRWEHGRNAAVMVGIPHKRTALVVIQIEPAQWLGGTAICEATSVAEAAKWIREFCCDCSNR